MEVQKSLKIPKQFGCEKCDYYALKKSDYTKHISTRKHMLATNIAGMEINGKENPAKKSPESNTSTSNYSCEKCNFSCVKKSNYEKHIITKKHKIEKNDTSYRKIDDARTGSTGVF